VGASPPRNPVRRCPLLDLRLFNLIWFIPLILCVYTSIYIYIYIYIYTYTLCICKVRCTLVQALRLCTGRTAHRGNRGIALLFLDYGTRKGWGVSVTPRPLFTPGKDPVPIVLEGGWAPGPVWTGADNLAPTGIRSPDRPASNQSYIYVKLVINRLTRHMLIKIHN